ncbi:FAD-dependent monooxygenase [Streptomyces corynorhini]|uniref:FAD-dependent oxidoreductase n=1 Tax=Streptomyces corynorhini TaxID=2282652 RepID=A0A370B9Y3_9ACTN|nr:FAD-dependent monooxygenase [Streptomyces corynorhini]RDG37199.1 FAD-dependent oxidoreductase [Streptomyces corynorhini]
MTETHRPRRTRSALVSGAGIAGPAIAYWLNRYGFDVTVVEKTGTVRGGGYPIDIRGTGLEVVRRMNLLPQLRKVHVATRRVTFVDHDGGTIAALRAESLAIGADGDLEVQRGDLTEALHDAVRDSVDFVFGDSITVLDDRPDGVEVTFGGGTHRTFDVVIGADGIHSHTRRLVLGSEERFHHYLGACFAGFTLPNHLRLSHEGVLWNTPGRRAALYAAGSGRRVFGMFSFRRSDPPFDAFRTPDAQRELIAASFPDDRWEIPRMVAEMRAAEDLFFDITSQIRMSSWSQGRVALVGDAAYAPSLLTGQGTSLALVGAYVLAGELAAHADHAQAFDAYERVLRPFVTLNQELANEGDTDLFPASEHALQQRNAALRALAALPADPPRAAYSALALPDYD